MFFTCSTAFCCLFAIGLEVSLHFWQSWPTVHSVHPIRFGNLSTALGYCLTCTLQFRRLDWIFIFTVNTRQSTLFLIFNLFYHYQHHQFIFVICFHLTERVLADGTKSIINTFTFYSPLPVYLFTFYCGLFNNNSAKMG